MHIVFFSRRAWPAVGGVERHLQFLCEELLRQHPALKISVITEQTNPSWPEQENHQGVKYFRFQLVGETHSPNIKKSVFEGMKKFSPVFQSADILHVHDVFFWVLPIFPLIAHKKIFVTFHGYEIPGPPNWRQKFWHQCAAGLSDGNICIGGFHQKWYGVEPTQTSFGATNFVSKNHIKRTEQSIKKILYVGRVDEDNSIWPYLEALAAAQKHKNFEFQLDVIGAGSQQKMAERFVQDNQLPVSFLGQQQVTSETYQAYDLTLGTGYLSILESLAAGVPVVASYVTLLKKDYLEKTPFAKWIKISAPGQDLVESVTQDSSLSEFAQNWAQQQNWQKLASEYLSLWNAHD